MRDPLRHLVVLVVLLDRPADLDVDRGGQTEIEDLAHDVRRLGEEPQIGESPRQLLAERLEVLRRRTMRRLHRHQDLPVRRPDGHVVAQGEVDVVRQADVVGDHRQLVGRDHLADVVLDLLEIDFCLFDPGAGRRAHVQSELAGVHRREEVAADEGIQQQ